MLFSETLASMQTSATGWTAEVGSDWYQGRATFGGMVAALGNESMRRLVPADRALRALEATFVGPLLAGTVRIQAEVLRIGKAVTIATARLWSEGQVAAALTGIYGASRPTQVVIEPQATTDVARVQELPDALPPPGVQLPVFLRHFGLRWAEGSAPYAGLDVSRSKAYIRHVDPAPLTESHVVALIDCIPPPLLQMMTRPAPASSLTWTLELLRQDYDFSPAAWWRIDTEIKGAGNGYSQQSSLVLNPDGRVMALSRQLVAVFG